MTGAVLGEVRMRGPSLGAECQPGLTSGRWSCGEEPIAAVLWVDGLHLRDGSIPYNGYSNMILAMGSIAKVMLL